MHTECHDEKRGDEKGVAKVKEYPRPRDCVMQNTDRISWVIIWQN